MLARLHRHELESLDEHHRVDRLVELNVVEQVRTLSRHPSVRAAWAAGWPLKIHGCVFDLARGILVPRVTVDRPDVWQLDTDKVAPDRVVPDRVATDRQAG
jgi:carbonic anhydrase